MSTLDWIEDALRPIFTTIADLHRRLQCAFEQAACGVRDGYRARAWWRS
jgi:hypothetical protein